MELIKKNELGLSYLTHNEWKEERPTALLLHGFPDNAYVWKSLAPFLKEFNIIAPFFPKTIQGCELSHKDYRLEAFKNLLEPHLKDIDLVISHDMGGIYANYLMTFLDEKVLNICLNTANGRLFFESLFKTNQWRRSLYMPVLINPLVTKGILAALSPLLEKYIEKKKLLDKKLSPKEYDGMQFNGVHFYKQLLFDMPMLIKADKIQQKTYFIYGKKDPFLVKHSKKVLEEYYQDPIVYQLTSGHWIQLEKTKKFSLLLESILGAHYE